MALFRRKQGPVGSAVSQISDLVGGMRKRVLQLEHISRSLEHEIIERGVLVDMQLNHDVSNIQLLKKEIGALHKEIHKKGKLLSHAIIGLKRCVLEKEFEAVRKKMERWDPADLITRKEFLDIIKE